MSCLVWRSAKEALPQLLPVPENWQQTARQKFARRSSQVRSSKVTKPAHGSKGETTGTGYFSANQASTIRLFHGEMLRLSAI